MSIFAETAGGITIETRLTNAAQISLDVQLFSSSSSGGRRFVRNHGKALVRLRWLAIGLSLIVSIGWIRDSAAEQSDSGGGASITAAPTSLFSRSPFHLILSVESGYDDNVSTSQQRQGSAFTDGVADLTATFGTERWHLTLTGIGQLTYFTGSNVSTNPETNSHFEITATYAVSKRLALTAHSTLAYQAEPDFSANIGPQQRVGYFFTTDDQISAMFQWFPDISTVTNESIRVVKYDSSIIGQFTNRIEETIGEQLRYSLVDVVLTAEYDLQLVRYDSASLDSTSHNLLAGFNYGITRRLKVMASGGVTFRSFEQGGNSTEPRVEANLEYALGRASTLRWSASYGLEQPDNPLFVSRTTFRTGLEVKHWLTRRILGSLSAYYNHDDNQMPATPLVVASSTEDSYSISASLQYSFNRRWGVHVGYDRSEVTSGIAGFDYSRNHYGGGFNVSF